MRKIIKSYLKSYFKNFIEAFGLIFFMIIIMATVAGILSAPIQYLSHLNAVTRTSKEWNNSLELIVPNPTNGVTKNAGGKLVINKPSLYQANFTSLKPWFLVDLLTNEHQTDKINNFPIININSPAYKSWQAATSIITQQPISNNQQQLGVFLNNEIFSTFNKLRVNFLGTLNSTKKDQLAIPNSNFWKNFKKVLDSIAQQPFIPITIPSGSQLSPLQKTWTEIFTQYDFNLQLLIPHYLFNVYQQNHPGQKLLWNYRYFHNILLQEKSKLNKDYAYLLETNDPIVYSNNNDYQANALKLYSGQAPRAPNSAQPQQAEAAVGYSAAQKNGWHLNTNITLYTSLSNTLILHVKAIGITLDTVIVKTGSTLSDFSNNSFFSPPILNYSPIYTSNTVINELEGAYLNNQGPSSRYQLTDCSELYLSTANGDSSKAANNQFNAILNGTSSPHYDPTKAPKAGDGMNIGQSYLTYKEGPVATSAKNNNTSLIINLAISFVLILLGFIFVNFTMKKEINKTCGQLGLFKAFGYRDLDLSWIFATKFFVTTIVSTGIGYLISLGIQPFVAQAYQTSVLFPFTTIYLSPIFLSFLFIVIPAVFVLISYSLNFYFLKQPVLNLINGNPRMRISLLARIFGRMFGWTTFVIRVQIAFTFKAFSKYLAVLFVFIIAALLFQATFSGLYLFSGLSKNLFITSRPDVDHISYADNNLTDSHLNPTFKPPNPPPQYSNNNNNNNAVLPHLQFNNKVNNTKYIPAPNGINQKVVTYFNKNYSLAIDTITRGFSNDLSFFPNPTGLDFWKLAHFKLEINGETILPSATIKDIFEKAFPGQAPPPQLMSILAYIALTSVHNYQWLDTPEVVQIVPTVNHNPYNPAQQAALNHIFKLLNIPKANQNLRFLANKITDIFAWFLEQPINGIRIMGKMNPWQMPLPATLNAFALTSLFALEQKVLQQKLGKNFHIYINANGKKDGKGKGKKFNADHQVSFVNKLLIQYPLLKDPAKSYIDINALYYDQSKEQPIFRVRLYDLQPKADRESFQAVGVDPQNWNQFWQFNGVNDPNSIINDNWTYQEPITPIPVIISQRLSILQDWKLNQIVPISLDGNISDPFRIKFRIAGIVPRDTLSDAVYINRNNLQQLFQLYGKNSSLLQDLPGFANGITSKRVLTNAKINIAKFQAGLQKIKFSIENIGVALLNSIDPQTSTSYQFWQVLGLTDEAKQPASKYDVDSNYSLLINTTRNIPISVIKAAAHNAIKQFQEILVLMEVLVTITTAIILIVVVSSVLDESKAVILMMKAIGYTASQVNFVVIGNYFIGSVVAFVLGYFINIGLWVFVNKIIYNSAGIVLGLPLAPIIPLIGFALVIGIITLGWIVSYNITKRSSLNEVSAEI